MDDEDDLRARVARHLGRSPTPREWKHPQVRREVRDCLDGDRIDESAAIARIVEGLELKPWPLPIGPSRMDMDAVVSSLAAAEKAARWRDVQAFRAANLPGGRVIPPADVRAWWSQRVDASRPLRNSQPLAFWAIELSPESSDDLVSFTLLGSVPVEPESVLGQLQRLVKRLVTFYGWPSPVQGIAFVLTGETPPVYPATTIEPPVRPAETDLDAHCARWTISVDPRMPPDELAEWYAAQRCQVVARSYNPPRLKALHLAEFLLTDSGAGTWKARFERWKARPSTVERGWDRKSDWKHFIPAAQAALAKFRRSPILDDDEPAAV